MSDDKKQQVLALGRLGWPLRRIEEATGIRRETASNYLKAAGIPVRAPGAWGRRPPKPANEVSTLHNARVLKCGPRSWRTKLQSDLHSQEAAG